MIWPVDFLYMIWGLIIVIYGDNTDSASPLGKLMTYLTRAHIAGMVILCLLTWGHFLEQNTSRVVAWFAPLTILVWGSSSLKMLQSKSVNPE